jgi:nitrogen fixation protein NifU and related proteins
VDQELAQELILDHDRNPRNFGEAASHTHLARGYSPLCGDSFVVSLRLGGGIIQELRFRGYGCAISKASASLMTEHLSGLPEADARSQARAFESVLMGTRTDPALTGSLEALLAVRRNPARVRCALLPWRALVGALEGKSVVEVR